MYIRGIWLAIISYNLFKLCNSWTLNGLKNSSSIDIRDKLFKNIINFIKKYIYNLILRFLAYKKLKKANQV
jgi:hypothetical protein